MEVAVSEMAFLMRNTPNACWLDAMRQEEKVFICNINKLNLSRIYAQKLLHIRCGARLLIVTLYADVNILLSVHILFIALF